MPDATVFRELLCPTCGYDLRGSPSLRCPECGTQSSQSAWSSRIPWVHRKTRGPLRAYIATLLMLLFHAPSLGHETRGRLARLPARRFHRISIALTIPVGLLVALGLFLIQNGNTFYGFGLNYLASPDWFALPVGASSDARIYFIAAPIAAWLSARALSWLMRTLLPLFAADRSKRRRIARLAYYLSGLLPLQFVFLGAASLFWNLADTSIPETLARELSALCLLLAAAIFLIPAIILIWTTGQRHITRTAITAVVYPALALAQICLITLATLWLGGYIALAIWFRVH